MKLRTFNPRSGAVLSESELSIGGYAIGGHVLLELFAPDGAYASAAFSLTPAEAADLATRLNAIAVLRRQE